MLEPSDNFHFDFKLEVHDYSMWHFYLMVIHMIPIKSLLRIVKFEATYSVLLNVYNFVKRIQVIFKKIVNLNLFDNIHQAHHPWNNIHFFIKKFVDVMNIVSWLYNLINMINVWHCRDFFCGQNNVWFNCWTLH